MAEEKESKNKARKVEADVSSASSKTTKTESANKNLKIEGVATKRAVKRVDIDESNSTESEKSAFTGAFFNGYNDYQVYVRTWANVDKPKAVVLIIHGMVEHGLRYDDFAKFLNSNGYIVVVPDLRGHGRTAGAPENVTKYDGDIFGDTVLDCIKLADTLLTKYNLPLFFIGHSYGSFITQKLLESYHKQKGNVLIGSSCYKGSALAGLGKMVAKITRLFKGKDARAKFLYNMTFANYGKHFDNANWLTSDERIFNDYNLDPYCGAVATAEFYISFFGGIGQLYKDEYLNQIDKDTPILITSGASDYVGGENHKDIDKLPLLYKSYGVKNVDYKLWENGRHEILNETFRADVYNYIVTFLNKCLMNN